MCCFVRTHVYVCVHNLCNFREEGCDWTPNVTGCTLQSVHVSVPLCLKSKSLLAMKYNNKVCFRQFWGTTRVICTDRQKERGGGLLHTDKMEEEGAEERARDRWGTKLNGSNTSPLILTNGRVTEWGDCKTHALSVTTTGINSRVSQWQWLESK